MKKKLDNTPKTVRVFEAGASAIYDTPTGRSKLGIFRRVFISADDQTAKAEARRLFPKDQNTLIAKDEDAARAAIEAALRADNRGRIVEGTINIVFVQKNGVSLIDDIENLPPRQRR